MPKQFTDLAPFFKRCSDGFFTGYDPPRTLRPATALSPVTRSDPVASPVTATPGLYMEPGPSNTATIDPDRGSRKSAVPSDPIETGSAGTGHVLHVSTISLHDLASAPWDPNPGRDPEQARKTAQLDNTEGSSASVHPKSQGGFQRVTSKQREAQVWGIESLEQNIGEGGIWKINIPPISENPKSSARIMKAAHYTFHVDRLSIPFDGPHVSNEIGQVEKGIDTIISKTTLQQPSNSPAQSTPVIGQESHEFWEPSKISHFVGTATLTPQKSPATASAKPISAFPTPAKPTFGVAVSSY